MRGTYGSFTLYSFPGCRSHPKARIYGNLISQKFLLLVRSGKLQEDFFLYLLNLKCLQLQIIFIPTLEFQEGPHDVSGAPWHLAIWWAVHPYIWGFLLTSSRFVKVFHRTDNAFTKRSSHAWCKDNENLKITLVTKAKKFKPFWRVIEVL